MVLIVPKPVEGNTALLDWNGIKRAIVMALDPVLGAMKSCLVKNGR